MRVILEGYQNRPLYYKSFDQLNNQLEQASKITGYIYMCEYDIKEDTMKVKIETLEKKKDYLTYF